MLKIHENIFDKRWIDELSHSLFEQPWFSNNIADRKTWPYGNKGASLFLGNDYFRRINDNEIIYNQNINFSKNLIAAFFAISNKLQRKMKLMEITANLQFKEMDGALHKDGLEKDSVFILMLCNDYTEEDIGGEFYHEPTNTLVPFKSGRLIEQNGDDLHKGLAFKKPNIARMSIKFVGENF